MRTLKLTIAYDGTRYAGWQTQETRGQPAPAIVKAGPGPATARPTIQGMLERTLHRILQEPVTMVGSGRTDAGVHALGQSAHLRTRATLPCGRLLRSINRLLPPDIAVTRIKDVPAAFHARFSVTTKRYRYRIFTGPVVLPFIRPYVHHYTAPLNLALMRREAALLHGRHDFRAFTRAQHRAQGRPPRTTTRTISSIRLTRRGRELHLDIEGNGFLYTMVRSIAGTLIDVGRGRLPPGTVRRMLEKKRRTLTGTTAPASGLTLLSVAYPKTIR